MSETSGKSNASTPIASTCSPGSGGWELALRLAGWPADWPVWTGSCPCQPFSSAGKRAGAADDRHLWPEMLRLIRIARPATIFGEQVRQAIGLGWLDRVFADLEAEGYACGAMVLGAHSVGAPHIRGVGEGAGESAKSVQAILIESGCSPQMAAKLDAIGKPRDCWETGAISFAMERTRRGVTNPDGWWLKWAERWR